MPHILIVEDETIIRSALRRLLERNQYQVSEAGSVQEAQERFSIPTFDLIVSDLRLPGAPGTELIKLGQGTPVLIMTSYASLRSAVDSMKMGAVDYIAKPFDHDEMLQAVARILRDRVSASSAPAEPRPTGKTSGAEKPGANNSNGEIGIIGSCPPMQDLYSKIRKVAPTDSNVLIQGESGTGKELVARALHNLSKRAKAPMISVNCAAIPETLIESELFGHEKGAFTGAVARHVGKFEQANGGTLFLDEIGDMPMQAQTRLLRALQSGTVRRVGGRDEIKVDVRIIAATNRDLQPMIGTGTFREDLFYRLNVVPITLPPLRDRADDIPALARHFLALAAHEGLPRRQLSDAAAETLSRQAWRGNVRELRNFVYRLALLSREDVIDTAGLAPLLAEVQAAEPNSAGQSIDAAVQSWLGTSKPAAGSVYDQALAAFERPLFEAVLRETHGNQLKAAQVLGINRNTLRKRLGELGINPGAVQG